jgi:nitroimidazol reductase NimA-like FMN-containing flavoprotein (pyridoxamine 5'-phosphate oxidase superfamily)
MDQGRLAPGIRGLTETECCEILARNRLCVMAMVDDVAPYAVPLYYGFDGQSMFLGVAEGRKTRALDRNPRVSVVVVETGQGAAWRSVQLTGRASVVTGVEREQALAVLVTHNRRFREQPGESSEPRPTPRRAGGRVLRIDEAVISGRASTSLGED